jgi:hypothetical protein
VVGSDRADGAVVPDLNDKKGHNHETYDNRTSKCFCSPEHGRHGASHDRRIIRCDAGTSWDCRIWISRGSVSGVVRVAVGRLDECRPHMEQHWPRSAFAQCPLPSVTPPGTPLPRSACRGADNGDSLLGWLSRRLKPGRCRGAWRNTTVASHDLVHAPQTVITVSAPGDRQGVGGGSPLR